MGIGITCKYKLDLVLPYPAAPAGGKARRRKHVPAVLIGNHQRQAAVRKTPRCVIHPLPLPGARPQIRRTGRNGIGRYLERFWHIVGLAQDRRSEERRGGKEWVSTCGSRWSPCN